MDSKNSKKHLITAALPYANGPIHIGHLAGAYLPADIYVRYLKLIGEKALFICGSDEHGAAITLRAKKENKSPQEIVDQYHFLNKKAFEDFGIEFDIFDRTSSEKHHEISKQFFTELYEKGVFEKKTSEQYYDEDYKQFLADRYINGTCPKCKNEGAYGDQCEKCGSALSSTELLNPKSTLSGKTPILKETSHWFLPMKKEETWLKEWIENGTLNGKKHHKTNNWRKHVIGQCKSWIDGGLQSRAMTRDLDWGVKVPLKDAEGKVLYVWLDAPIGYITATQEYCQKNNEEWKDYWQNENTELVHFIGKDNIVFHGIIFPILLKLNSPYILPKIVAANEFLNLESKKISTSKNWAVWLHEYNNDFAGKEDVLRYVLTSIAPENKDSEFTWSDFQARNNNELVAIFGNFINRTVVLTHKYYNGVVPNVSKIPETFNDTVTQIKNTIVELNDNLNKLKFRDAQNSAMNLARIGNKFLADTEPWKLIKTDEEAVKPILYLSMQIAVNCAIAFLPFLPSTSKKLQNMLGCDELNWSALGKVNLLNAPHTINKAELLFEKIEDDIIEKQIEKLKSMESNDIEIAKIKDTIQFEDFQKLDIRVGTILEAEKLPKSKKLLKLLIELGNERRTILSGISEYYSPEKIIGKQVQVICNLAPRKMMGIESQGMVLMAEDKEGLSLLCPDRSINPGSLVS